MVGVRPKFGIKWTKTDQNTWTVPGNTYEDVFKFFEKRNAARKEWATFHHEKPNLSFKPAKGEPITDVTLMVGYTITMPSWPKANSLGKKGKVAWDKMIKALEEHENQHRLILEGEAEMFGVSVTWETDLSLKKLTELFKKFPAEVEKAQKAYDAKTSHGKKEGVFLPAPEEVKD